MFATDHVVFHKGLSKYGSTERAREDVREKGEVVIGLKN